MVASLLLLGRTRFPASFFRRDNKTGLAAKTQFRLIRMDSVAERPYVDDARLQHYWLRTDQIHFVGRTPPAPAVPTPALEDFGGLCIRAQRLNC
jgi:hypothetical protein